MVKVNSDGESGTRKIYCFMSSTAARIVVISSRPGMTGQLACMHKKGCVATTVDWRFSYQRDPGGPGYAQAIPTFPYWER